MIRPYYEQDGITIYNGDCIEILSAMPEFGEHEFDALVTDPPYGIGYAADPIHHGRNHEQKEWDDDPPSRRWMYRLIDRVMYAVVWGGHHYELPASRCCLVWHKPDAAPSMSDVEIAWTNIDKPSQHLSWSIAATNRERVGHPTQKPEAVMRWSLQQLPSPRCHVLDPYAGSGTTLVAAKRLGLSAVGIEIEERYCEIAVKRLAQGALPLEVAG